MTASEGARAPVITDIIEYVAFRGERLELAWKDGEPYVAVKPICERLGLAWQVQHRKLTTPDSGLRCHHMVIPSAGGPQQSIGLHVIDLPLWLASISPAKVKPEVREALIAYRRECALVLFEHVKHRLLGERDGALDALSRLREEVIRRKPIRASVRQWLAEGRDFDFMWRSASRPKHVIIETVLDLERLGIIDRRPEGFPAPAPLPAALQPDLFGEG